MARRLVEQGVAFVEVSLGLSSAAAASWDTHTGNFATVKQLSQELDKGWPTLLSDLDKRGLLETTTVLWLGNSAACTPKINGNAGRDHFPGAWSCVFAGGGIRGGGAHGKTTADGMSVADSTSASTWATCWPRCRSRCGRLPRRKTITSMGRPIKVAEERRSGQDILA